MPAGVSTSHTMNRSASRAAGVPKLCTWREQFPAPRSSTGISSRVTSRVGCSARAGAEATATRPPVAVDTVRSRRIPV